MTTETRVPLGEQLANYVAKKARELQSAYRRDDSAAVAALAILRRGVAQPLGQDARLVGLTVGGLRANPNGLPDEPLPDEQAAYAALTLFALHQQGHRDQDMHRAGYPFGRSARLLGRKSGSEDAVRRRFTAVATATSWDETVHHARGLIMQFRAQQIPLDYGQFARDLFGLQNPRYAERVRLSWGRHFYRVNHPDDDAPSETNDTEPETD